MPRPPNSIAMRRLWNGRPQEKTGRAIPLKNVLRGKTVSLIETKGNERPVERV
jgi:hypothetical protein